MSKKTCKLFLLGGLSLLALAGCNKQGTDFATGDTVSFNVKLYPSNVLTKTAYSGETVTVDNKKVERIDWAAGDQFRLYAKNATQRYMLNQHYSDYEVLEWKDNGRYSEASTGTQIQPITEYDKIKDSAGKNVQNGLVWSADNQPDDFWAVYPIPTSTMTVTESSATVEGLDIPKEQNVTINKSSETVTVLDPDLSKGGYMVAMKKNAAANTKFNLDFYPAFTALEFTLYSKYDLTLHVDAFKITSAATESVAATGLTGKFKAEVKEDGASVYTVNSDANNEISVDFTQAQAGGIEITKTKSMTFTVLALPQDLKNLTIDFTIREGESTAQTHRKLKMTKKNADTGVYEPITFDACKKHRIYGLAMPSGELLLSYEVNPWVVASDITYESNVSTELQAREYYWRFDLDGNYGNEGGKGSHWEESYLAVSYGYSNSDGLTINTPPTENDHPRLSDPIQLNTNTSGVEMELHLDNPKFKFVEYKNGKFDHTLGSTLHIDAGEHTTYFYVVPVEEFSASVSETEKKCIVYLTTVSASTASIKWPFNSASLPGNSIDSSEIWVYYLAPSDYGTSDPEKSGYKYDSNHNLVQ